MDKQEGNSICGRGCLVYVMDVELWEAVGFDGFVVVGEFIQFCFLSPPVKSSLPVFYESFDVCKRCAICPS